MNYVHLDLDAMSLSRLGLLEEKRERLKEALLLIADKNQLLATVEGAQYPDAMIAIRQAIPCILHCENHCSK
jgi:hypothetical protein